MYLPKHFTATDTERNELLASVEAADLITPTAEGLYATFLPLMYEPLVGDSGALLGHVARKNDHHRLAPTGESMVIVHGPQAYITPGFYATKRETGKVVPTWNYLTAHIYGELIIHDDSSWLERFVNRLTDQHEAGREHPWAVDDAPREYIEGQLKAIVGVELRISRVEAKAKLGQNRRPDDIDGVITGLGERGGSSDADLARATERARATTRSRRD